MSQAVDWVDELLDDRAADNLMVVLQLSWPTMQVVAVDLVEQVFEVLLGWWLEGQLS